MMEDDQDDSPPKPVPTATATESYLHSSPPTPPTLSVVEFEEKDERDQELIRLALHKSPFFTCLDDEQVERFIQVAELKRYSAGQSIILEGCVDDFDLDDAFPSQSSGDESADARAVDPDGHTGVHKTESDQEVLTEEGFVVVEKSNDVEELEMSKEGLVDQSNEVQNSEAPKVDSGEPSTSDSSIDQDRPQDQTIKEDAETNISILSAAETSPKDNINNNNTLPVSSRDNPSSRHYLEPPPPRSGVPSYIYIIKSGQADVMYSQNNLSVNSASLGTGTVFGEGGFLFGRQHSASVMAAADENLECFVVDAASFRNFVLPSDYMTRLYHKHAKHVDETTNTPYMTMQDFVNSCLNPQGDDSPPEQEMKDPAMNDSGNDNNNDTNNSVPVQDPMDGVSIANTFNILRNGQTKGGAATKFSQQRISLADFCLFHLLMSRPDPEVDITFMLIDERKRGVIYKEDLGNFLKSSMADDDFTFDMDSEFIHRHFGQENDKRKRRYERRRQPQPQQQLQQQHRGIRPHQFSQFLVDLRREIGQQVFLQEVERNGTAEGYLPLADFVKVLKKACGWRLPQGVADRLDSICQSRSSTDNETDDPLEPSRQLGNHYFSYCDFLAYQEVLGQLSGICNLIDRACEIKKPLSADDLKVANRVLGMGGRLSRRQVDIIFQLFDLDGDGFVSHEDTVAVAGPEITQRIDAVAGRQGALTFAPPPKYRHHTQRKETGADDIFVLLENLSLTSIAGCIGVFALAPLDLVKTRVMNERVAINGTRMYKNSLDCLRIALASEGHLGMYRGLLPQLIGVAPEKALKLAVNDLVKQSLGVSDTGPKKTATYFLTEMLAGGCAGACQLVVTNPIEIVKIRMQLQGETARLLKAKGFDNPVPQSLRAVIKNLGYAGLFQGARACLLRDIPFGAIYFPTYALLKESLSTDEGHSGSISASNLLLAGTLAGIPASFLTTPADVIKTRLQVIPRPGETGYDGIRDCFTKVLKTEGSAAFFKGWTMRVAKISPQFGISLVAYEQLSQLLGAKGLFPPTTVPVDPKDYLGAFPSRAIKNKTDDTDGLLKTLGSSSLRPTSATRQWDEKR